MPVKQAVRRNPGSARRWSPEAVAGAAQLACVLELSAEKPGNITPRHDFDDTTYEDMLRSAIALGPVLGRAGEHGVGDTVLAAVQATRMVARANTNLGIALLLAPPARAAFAFIPAAREVGRTHARAGPVPDDPLRGRPTAVSDVDPPRAGVGPVSADPPLRARVAAVLGALTLDDARAAYAAIRLAEAGGLEAPVEHDVRDEPRVTLREAMIAAAGRDAIAAEYAGDFALTFEFGVPALADALGAGVGPRDAVVELALRVLAAVPDTLIARKRGLATAERVSAGAGRVLAAGGVRSAAGRGALEAFDASLRADGNALNPGTTADLVTAALFVALLEGML